MNTLNTMGTDTPLVTPPSWKGPPLEELEGAVMAATVPDIRRICRRLRVPPENGAPLFTSRFHAVRSTWALVGPFIGAAHAVMLVETLRHWGIRQLVFFGWCGTVDPALRAGDVILPTAGISDDGTSKHYSRVGDPPAVPAANLTRALETSLLQADLTVHRGAVCSTDGIFRETPGKVADFRRRGALAVDMEVAAVLTAAGPLGIDVGAALLISDDISGSRWLPGFASPRFKKARECVHDALIRLCETLWNPASKKEQKNSESS